MFLDMIQKAGLIAFSNGKITPLQQTLPVSIENLQHYLTHVKETSARDPHNAADEEANKRKLVEEKPITILGYRLTSLGKQQASLYAGPDRQSMADISTREMPLSGEGRSGEVRPLAPAARPERRLHLEQPRRRFAAYLR